MDVERVFHMKEGLGDKSYAQNSSLQRRAIDMVKHITIDTILDLYLTKSPQSLGIADLGCSSGPNTLSVIKDIITAIQGISHKIRRPTPEFRVSLNDLPSNDFNSVFMALPDLYKELGRSMVFISAVPGSFYGRLFPGNSLHFVHASYSLHWLSKVPPGLQDKEGKSINKGNVYISESSNPMVSEAYLSQFQEDFSYFLSSRSEEMVSGGRMVLTLLGRRTGQNHIDRGNSFFWDLLSRSLKIMVDQGEIEEEKLNSYDVHFYAPSRDEIEHEVKKEGSFAIDCFEMLEIEREDKRNSNYARTVTMTVRAIQESMISHHFGQGIVNNLFEIYGNLIEEEIVKEAIRPITFTVVLRKLAGITRR